MAKKKNSLFSEGIEGCAEESKSKLAVEERFEWLEMKIRQLETAIETLKKKKAFREEQEKTVEVDLYQIEKNAEAAAEKEARRIENERLGQIVQYRGHDVPRWAGDRLVAGEARYIENARSHGKERFRQSMGYCALGEYINLFSQIHGIEFDDKGMLKPSQAIIS